MRIPSRRESLALRRGSGPVWRERESQGPVGGSEVGEQRGAGLRGLRGVTARPGPDLHGMGPLEDFEQGRGAASPNSDAASCRKPSRGLWPEVLALLCEGLQPLVCLCYLSLVPTAQLW